MANLISVTVLQKNQYNTAAGGVVTAIPALGIIAEPYTGTVNGTVAHATITIPPSGLNQRSTTLIVTSTVAQIVTAANAALA
jgi:hypothetical protein